MICYVIFSTFFFERYEFHQRGKSKPGPDLTTSIVAVFFFYISVYFKINRDRKTIFYNMKNGLFLGDFP